MRTPYAATTTYRKRPLQLTLFRPKGSADTLDRGGKLRSAEIRWNLSIYGKMWQTIYKYIENSFGNCETLRKTFERALQSVNVLKSIEFHSETNIFIILL